MKWFKHSTLAAKQLPVRQIREEYGFYGLGVFWCIMEDVVLSEGSIKLEELKHSYCSKNFGKAKVEDIIMGFGCFTLDTHTRVKIASRTPTVMPIVDDSNTHAFKREKEIREEENPLTPVIDSVATRMATPPSGVGGLKRDWCIKMQDYKGEYRDTVCMRSGFSSLLNRRWKDAFEYFTSHLTALGEIDERCTETEFKRRFSMFVWSGYTGKQLCDALKALDEAEKNELDKRDYMSTYFGPQVPDNAPPRPSHTAVYDFTFNKWEEPRGLTN